MVTLLRARQVGSLRTQAARGGALLHRAVQALAWRSNRIRRRVTVPAGHRSRVALRAGVQVLWLRCLKLWFRATGRHRPVVVIFLCEHFGDIVAAEPISRALRARHSDAHIVWLVSPPFACLVRHNPAVDGLLVVKCVGQALRVIRSSVPDHSYSLHVPGLDCPLCGVQVPDFGRSHDITFGNYYFEGRSLLDCFCAICGVEVGDRQPRVNIPPSARQRVERFGLPADYVVLHTRSRSQDRNWPDESWKLLLKRILDTGLCHVVEVGLQSPLSGCAHPRFRSLCGRLALLETAEVIRRSCCFVGVDSGPAHFANALCKPSVILLGDFGGFHGHMPYSGAFQDGDTAEILRSEGPVATLSVEAVWAALRRKLSDN